MRRYRRKQKLVMILMLLLGIGFATITTILYSYGTVNIKKNDAAAAGFDVRFIKAKLGGADVSDTAILPGGKKIVYGTEDLVNAGDESVLDFKVRNESTLYDAEVSVECSSGEHSEYYGVTTTVDGLTSTTIGAKQSKWGSIKVMLIKEATEDISDNFTCTINAMAVERAESAEDLVPLEDIIKVGDYVSMTPSEDSYTISTDITGESSAQTITPNELNLWRVISTENGVEAVSEYTSSKSVSFKGVRGFANYVGGLQEIASHYANSNYTSSVRMMGYDGQTLTIEDTSAFDGTLNDTQMSNSVPSPTTGTGQEYYGGFLHDKVMGDTLYLKDYQLVSNVYKSDPGTYGSDGLHAYGVNTIYKYGYVLASRYYNTYTATTFGTRYISGGATPLSYSWLCFHADNWSYNNGGGYLRPIITLKSSVNKSGGTGTISDPYILAAS